MSEWRKLFEAEDSGFAAIHRGQVCLGRSLEEPNEISAVPDQITVQPGEIVVLSTIKAG